MIRRVSRETDTASVDSSTSLASTPEPLTQASSPPGSGPDVLPDGQDQVPSCEKVETAESSSLEDPLAPTAAAAGGTASRGSTRLERRLLGRLLEVVGQPPLIVELWDGARFGEHETPVGTLRVNDRGALAKILTDPSYQYGEMYAEGRLSVDGPLDLVMTALFRAMSAVRKRPSLWVKVLQHVHRPRPTTQRASKENIHHHYDIGNDFYKLWLDEQMAYTCAYFPDADATLEEAQRAKFDHVCRKVRLEPGMAVVEAGCGWGGLALHMAEHYGVRVRAYNISHEQIAFARQQAAQRGLAEKVEFVEDDWRNAEGPCDAFVSVGMLEHVGRKNYRRLGEVIDRCLTPQGRGLIHTIGQNQSQPFSIWIERRIFPGAYPPTLAEMMDIFSPQDFSVLDVENLRLHYAQTLRHWLARFEDHVEQIREEFDDQFVRMWRLYLAGSVASFEVGYYQLYQVVFNRNGVNDIPWTREYLYTGDGQVANKRVIAKRESDRKE